MRKSILYVSLFAFWAASLVSCEKDDTKPGKYENGAIVLNEGAFMQSNASVSWVSYQSDSVVNNVFENVNGRPLGDVLQGGVKANGKIYLVLNNSGKVVIVNSADFVQTSEVANLNNPRYAVVVDGKLYVSQWNGWGQKGAVMVFNANGTEKLDSIPVGTGAEGVIYSAGKVWVANSGGYGVDSTITIINTSTNKVEKILQVGYCPKEFSVDANGKVWVLCSGSTIYDANWNVVGHKPSSLVAINSTTMSVEKTINLFADKHPSHIDISPDKQTLYFGGGYGFNGIYSVQITETTISQNPLIIGYYYGFNVNPINGDIYTLEAPNFNSAGSLKVYNNDGSGPKKTVSVGIGPNGVLFN